MVIGRDLCREREKEREKERFTGQGGEKKERKMKKGNLRYKSCSVSVFRVVLNCSSL